MHMLDCLHPLDFAACGGNPAPTTGPRKMALLSALNSFVRVAARLPFTVVWASPFHLKSGMQWGEQKRHETTRHEEVGRQNEKNIIKESQHKQAIKQKHGQVHSHKNAVW